MPLPKLGLSALLLAVLVGVLLFLRANDPQSSGFPYPPCPTRSLARFYCPGCGSTRALFALTHLDPAGAFRKNAAFVILAPMIAVGVAGMWLAWLAPGRASIRRWLNVPQAVSWVLLAALLVFGVLRNLPFEPFCLLAPH